MTNALSIRQLASLKVLQWMGLVEKQQLASVESRGGWWPIIREPYAGAWQSNVEVSLTNVLTHPTVFACVSLIASDIGKMRIRLVERDQHGIWSETDSTAFSPVLRKPNHYQTRIKFFEQWLLSKLIWGNTYVLKARDHRRVVSAMYVLDPQRVRPLVAPDGSVFYEVKRDDLSLQHEDIVIVPADEIIHDICVALYHPLVGVSPIHAAGVAATQGLAIQENSTQFFANGSQPGGVLTAPGAISQQQAETIKAAWETNYGGENVGKVAVLGNGLKYEPMMMSAHDAQLIEQLRWSDETICRCFHVPAYKVGVGDPPNYNNIGALNEQYYSECLQNPIECIELLLDEGLGLSEGRIQGRQLGTEFDLDDLKRMDPAALAATEKDKVLSGLSSPNESRSRLNLPPVAGGDSPMMQQQQFSLAALAERDRDKPFAKPTAPAPAAPAAPEEQQDDEVDKFGMVLWTKWIKAHAAA